MTHAIDEVPMVYKQKVETEAALRMLGFADDKHGGLAIKWSNLRLSASFTAWLGGWMITGSYATADMIAMPEIRVECSVAPVVLMAALYKVWRDVFRDEPCPEILLYGKLYLAHEKRLRMLIPPGPALWAEREFFRFCVGYIERMNDWSKEDYEIGFSYADGQLKLSVGKLEIHCPARGTWPGPIHVSGRQLFRRLPKRFIGDPVNLGAEHKKIIIASHVIPARWEEKKPPQKSP